MISVDLPLQRARRRLAHVTSLTSNVGLVCTVQRGEDQKLYWVLDYYDGGSYMGMDVYAHERSLMRAVWRKYRKATGE